MMLTYSSKLLSKLLHSFSFLLFELCLLYYMAHLGKGVLHEKNKDSNANMIQKLYIKLIADSVQ